MPPTNSGAELAQHSVRVGRGSIGEATEDDHVGGDQRDPVHGAGVGGEGGGGGEVRDLAERVVRERRREGGEGGEG